MSYSSFTVRVGGNVVRAGREAEVISSLSQHSGHREVLLLIMPSVGQSAFLLSTLLSYKPSDSSFLSAWVVCWDFSFPAVPNSSSLLHFGLETQEL